ncbi:MAG TPA: ABC transporter substrate-binding protein [Candidatus Saccharimonadia bacterium]|nr:ABC transporter substrate-binding protein [Candidatus Saccharimonadia bacterium]
MRDDKHRESLIRAMNRRAFLVTMGGVAGSVVLDTPLTGRRAWADQPTGAAFQLSASEPQPKYGGTLRYGVLSAPAHFDVHQSGTISNMAPQGPMYDNLIRRDPRDGHTIIPDLASHWEIAPDTKTYTFFLRRGVLFHDGAEFTAEDVKATYARIIWPPKGISIPRTPLFAAVSDINTRDRYTIEFKLSEPRPTDFMLGAFASGWNIIVRKKTLEDNNYNLRTLPNFPGTGPFRHVSRIDKEVWILEKNPQYWNTGLPYLDRLEIYHLGPWSPELAAAFLAGKLDYARVVDPVTLQKIKATPGMTGAGFYQSVIIAAWINNTKKPFQDPRVRRALHLALDRHALLDVVKEMMPAMVGGFNYPFSVWSPSTEELSTRLGYRPDPKASIQEARRLLAEAGYAQGLKGVDFLVRDAPDLKLRAEAMQAMLKEALNIETNLRTVQISAWFDDAQAGNFDLTIGAIVSTLLEPSDYLRSWYSKDGPQNYAKWHNEAFEHLLPQIDREGDSSKRQALVRQADDILEQDPALLPLSWLQCNDAWYTYVKGQNPANFFGTYDVVRWDIAWLDK